MAAISGDPEALLASGARGELAANVLTEEPDAVIPHVRICGGPGAANARGYPTPSRGAGTAGREFVSYSTMTRGAPFSTVAPSFVMISVIFPAFGALSSFSIFIASTTTSP